MTTRRQILNGAGAALLALSLPLPAIAKPSSAPKTKGTNSMTKILMITTSASTMIPSDEPTGVWLEELTTPITRSATLEPRSLSLRSQVALSPSMAAA